MHEVLVVQPVVEKLPLKITSLDAQEHKLVVGTETGSLLLYAIEEDPFAVTLLESRVNPSSKPVEQCVVIATAGAVAVLSGAVVTLYDLNTLASRAQLDSSKGATLMALQVHTDDWKADSQHANVALCVVVKRNMVIYDWDGSNFVQQKIIPLLERPRSVHWVGENIYAGFTRNISCINSTTGAVVELYSFKASLTTAAFETLGGLRIPKLSVEPMPPDTVLITRENVTISVQRHKPNVEGARLEWSSYPEDIAYMGAYAFALIPAGVEVRRFRTSTIVQTIPIPGAQRMLLASGIIYVASQSCIWRLLPLDFEDQVEQLLATNQFAEAQSLIEEMEYPSVEDKAANIIRVRGIYAHHLFTQERKYEEAISILKELHASPIDVINLYPELSSTDSGVNVESLTSSDRRALQLLMSYLTEQRTLLVQLKSHQEYVSHQRGSAPSENPALQETLFLCEAVDTALLKVYTEVSPALVRPLLRIPNACNVSLCEELLLKKNKVDELVDLYRGKGLHRQALDFLKSQAASPDSTASELERMVQYLHTLKFADHLQLILEYAAWILQKDHEEGMKIFTEHFDEIDPLSTQRIIHALELLSTDAVLEYLEYLVHELHNSTPDIHDRLVIGYISKLKSDLLATEGLAGPMLPARPEAGPRSTKHTFWDYRKKLGVLLETSQVYDAERILALCPNDALFEERALVLGRLKRHGEALIVYVEKVRNFQAANKYCEAHYDPDDDRSRDVFLLLLELYWNMYSEGNYPLDDILSFLSVYGAKMDPIKALSILPLTLPLRYLTGFFDKCLHDMHRSRNTNEIVKSLLKAEGLQCKAQRLNYSTKRITIAEDRMCSVCLKRIGSNVFTSFPTGAVAHVYCATKES
ncbi:Vam6/Vps39-like protein [Gaertneriomyces sp. JEL0708]|nr:Vam6/Vps39-like protein [Gaertneriomyces sp. JEL0708]